jgi:hypothetical protein
MAFTDFVSMSSSNVRGARYDADEQILEIKFRNGTVYWYYGVGEEVWDDFLNAPSKGRFVWEYLRDNYDYERIR